MILYQIEFDKSVAEIKRRNIFKSVKTLVKNGSENNLKVIDVTVEEQPTGEISAGAGIGTGGSFAFDIKKIIGLAEEKDCLFL